MTGITYLMKRSIRSLTIREIEGIDKKGYFFSTVENAMEECRKLGIQISEEDEFVSYHRIISTNDENGYESYVEMEFPTHKENFATKHNKRR